MHWFRLAMVVASLPATLPVTSAMAAPAITPQSTAPIAIPATGSGPGPGAPYPASLAVSGAASPVQDVNATILNFSHTCAPDLDLLLVGPAGQSTMLFSEAGGDCVPAATNVNILFDDEAPTSYPCGANPSGTFKPTNDAGTPGNNCEPAPDFLPPPAPGPPYPVSLGVFDGTAPTGTWNLFAFDDTGADMGSIDGGWSLRIETLPQTTITSRPPNTGRGHKARYNFTSDEPGSIFECKLASKKKATFRACASPFKAKVGDGKHKFLVRATDPQGGLDPTPVKDKFKVLD